VTNVEGDDGCGATLEKNLSKSTRGSTHIEGCTTHNVNPEAIETGNQLMCSPRDVVIGTIYSDVVCLIYFEGSLRDGLAIDTHET